MRPRTIIIFWPSSICNEPYCTQRFHPDAETIWPPDKCAQPNYSLNSTVTDRTNLISFRQVLHPTRQNCGLTKARNVTQFCNPHLQKCIKYLNSKSTNQRSIKPFSRAPETPVVDLFVRAIFTSNANFSQHETSDWQAIFTPLGFILHSRKKLREFHLRAQYDRVKAEVEEIAAASQNIQIDSDGSSNIARERVDNISLLVGDISFYWKSKAIGATAAEADWTVQHVLEAAKEITKGNLERFTVFSSDTCNPMRCTWAR
ncbi:hypothetical protein K3495_g1621 [Podosphaera aphanis]|nr:hypothetical protein K3495_g1621 [Podosphaera aphanis]